MLTKTRIEAFSDAVIAIIITIMIFDLKLQELPPNFTDKDVWKTLLGIVPKLLSFTLSFVVLAIMWLNHHSLFDKIPHTDSKLVWYNAFLLFSMSLIPLPTAFLAEHPTLYQASMFYGLVMFLNAFTFFLMRRYVEVVAKLIPYNAKVHRNNMISTSLYLVSIPLSFVSVYLSFIIFVGIPFWYFLPEKHSK
ncbi:MAG: TMEM175 family protein [Ferruginibacter sp.]